MRRNPKDPPKKYQFKKGVSGNPLGGKLHDPELKKLRNLTKEEMIEVGSLLLKGSIKELKAIAKDEEAGTLKCMLAAVAARTIAKGDPYALEVILNRLIGKVKDEVKHSGIPAASSAPQVFVTLPSNGREAKLDGKD